MSDFVGTSPFLKIALRVAIETMHFHIGGMIFLGIFFSHSVRLNNLVPMTICPGVQGR